MSGAWFVHVWMHGEKRPKLLGSDGYLTRLRIHAIHFDSEAKASDAAAFLVKNNAEMVAKAEPVRS